MVGVGGTAPFVLVFLALVVGCARTPPREKAPAAPVGSVEPVAVIFESTNEERPKRRMLPPPSLSATVLVPGPSTSAQPTRDGATCEAERIQASHIMVAWGGAHRAAITEPVASRTKEQAHKRIKEALKKARAGADFAKLAGEYSDEPQAATRGGKLGSFSRTAMVKPFADAAFALCPGELSDVVETLFGYHVILRTE